MSKYIITLEKLKNDYNERQKFYHSKQWRDLRNYVLALEPFCVECKKRGIITLAIDVDHIIDIQDRPQLALNADNCQSLCKKCHSKKTTGSDKTEDLLNKMWDINLLDS